MWHKSSLMELLIENKYSFSGKAGSTGGLVSKALFTFCPTIKVGKIALDGDDSTDLEIQIGKGYKVTEVHGSEELGYVPTTEPTSAQNADVEIGFKGKRIFIGSIEAGGYLGTTIKPQTTWTAQSLQGYQVRRRTNGLTRALGRLLDGYRTNLPGSFTIMPDTMQTMNEPYGNMSYVDTMAPKEFIDNVLDGISSIEWMVTSDGWRLDTLLKDLESYQDHPNYGEAMNRTEQFISTLRGPGAYGNNEREVMDLWSKSLSGVVDWDGNRSDPRVSGKQVNEAKGMGKCFWLQFKPQSNQPEMKSVIENHGAWQSTTDAWKEAYKNASEELPVPPDIDKDKLILKGSANISEPWDTLPGEGGGGLAQFLNDSALKVSAKEQLEIWNSIGDDYFVFLDVQSGEETARIVRSKNAPIPGIGHWSAQALVQDELIGDDGKPYSTNRVRDRVPPEAVFEITPEGEVASIPELEVKIIPLLSKVIKNDAQYTGQYKSANNGRVELYLTWDKWAWEAAEAYPFNPRMMQIVKKYEVKKK